MKNSSIICPTMMRIFVATLILLVTVVSANRGDLYEIPTPEIVAFSTGGFRISISENPGITAFRFHGNVNEEIQPLRPGMINMETQQQTNGKWALESEHPSLKIGDYLYYWIFVKKDRLGYVRQPHSFQINELVPYFEDAAPTPKPPSSYPPFEMSVRPWNYPTAPNDTISSNLPCSNNNHSLIKLQNQVHYLTNTVELLIDVIEKLPGAKKLTLSGRIPPDGNAAATVRFILWEKLDLQPNVVSAQKNNDSSITFEVETLHEKIEVLKMAQDKLVNSKIIIS